MVRIIKTTFQLKRGNSDLWASLNPILSAGEPGYELDTHKLKIGDGHNFYNDLPYINSSNDFESEFNFVSKEQIQKLFEKEGTKNGNN